jgi:hypothetical protein
MIQINLKKVISKKHEKKLCFDCVLKVTDKRAGSEAADADPDPY